MHFSVLYLIIFLLEITLIILNDLYFINQENSLTSQATICPSFPVIILIERVYRIMKSNITLSLICLTLLFSCDVINKEDIEPAYFTDIMVNNDEFTVKKGEAIFLDFLSNDSIASEVSLTVGNPIHGVLTKDSSMYFTYASNSEFVGIDSFQYMICNKLEKCEEGRVVIHVVDNVDSVLTSEATLIWTGDYEVDGCGFIIVIDQVEYKPINEDFIAEELKDGETEVTLTYIHLTDQIEKFCGDKPDPFIFEAIRVLSVIK